MRMIFDKDLGTEKTIDIDVFNEFLLEKRLTANSSLAINQNTVFPDFSGLADNRSFTTVEIVNNDNVEIELINDYNKIINANVNCFDDGRQYQINITLGYEA